MSYALESSKRKFNRLLDSLASTSPAPLASTETKNPSETSVGSLPASKRIRLGAPSRAVGGLASALVRNGTTSTLSLATKLDTDASPGGKTMAHTRLGDQVTPYAPSSRSDFLLRLKTFSIRAIDKWDIKPDSINEVEWAKRGWVLDGKETVRCTCCNYRFVVKYSEQEDDESVDETLSYADREALREDARAALAAKYSSLIINGHSSTCSWRHKGCDDTIYRLPVNHPARAIVQLRSRFESVLKLHMKFPKMDIPTSVDLSAAYEDFKRRAYPEADQLPILPDSEVTTRSTTEVHHEALAFALFGWTADVEEQPPEGMVTCQACFRRLGFWIWKASSVSNPDDPMICNVCNEHRPYCPWINGETQNAGAALYKYEEEDLAAWEGLLRFLRQSRHQARSSASGVAESNNETAMAAMRPGSSDGEVTANSNTDKKSYETEDNERLGKWERIKRRLSLKPKTNVLN